MSRPEDSANEVKLMNPGIGQMIPFPSIWGHWYDPSILPITPRFTMLTSNRAGGPGDSKEDVKWLDEKLKEFFEKNKIENSKDEALQMLQSGMSSLKF